MGRGRPSLFSDPTPLPSLPLSTAEDPLGVGTDDLQAQTGRKGWKGASPRHGPESPCPPVGRSPADGHGQWGLRWGLLEQLLELQQVLLERLLLVEHGGCEEGGRESGRGVPGAQPQPAGLARCRLSFTLLSRSGPERATRALRPFNSPPIPRASRFNHPPANCLQIFPTAPPPNAPIPPSVSPLSPLRSLQARRLTLINLPSRPSAFPWANHLPNKPSPRPLTPL